MIFYDVQGADVETKLITGQFTWNGTTVTKSTTNNGGLGWSIAHSSTGIAVVTLADVYPAILYTEANQINSSASAEMAHIGATSASAATITINNVDHSTSNAPALANPSAEQTYQFYAIVRLSTVT